jgi:catechol 2,3-dioxygenase-like lactoylglutathione lyase family enzyme
VLSDCPVGPGLPASDFDRARAFYADTLGLPIAEEGPGTAVFLAGEGTKLVVYASEYAGTNKATAAGFEVPDLAAVMAWLRGRGVEFHDYDLPGLTTEDGVATFGPNKIAYFSDTEGNILSLAQIG